jgi:phosphate transport system substrate-binding protein
MMRAFRRRLFLNAAAGLTVAPAFSKIAGAAEVRITGGGSATVSPLLKSWIETAPETLGAKIAYDATDSAPGRNAVMGGEVDYAMSDEPMPPKDLDQSDLAQIPAAYGCIAVVVNIPGVEANKLKLNGEILAGLFDGGIKKWNDPKIVALNGDLKLPDLAVTPVSQGTPTDAPSGTTHAFTGYLLDVSAEWKQKFPSGVKGKWGAGTQVLDPAAAAYSLQTLQGGVSYVPLPLAQANKMTTTLLVNKAGKPVAPGTASLTAAVGAIDWSKSPDMVIDLGNLPGDGSWPIVSVTYALFPKNPPKKPKGAAVKAFFKHILTNGGDAAQKLGFVVPPPAGRDLALAVLEKAGG